MIRNLVWRLNLFPSRGVAISSKRGYRWSVEKESNHDIPPASAIIDEDRIHKLLEETREDARDAARIDAILAKAKEKALLKDIPDALIPTGEYVQGLDERETATLLNLDANSKMMKQLCDTAFEIKERIYGNRIVLFAPLYLSDFCVNSCTYCAFRGQNKDMKRSKMTREELIDEVKALQRQGHRRILLLTGESPQYTFDDFLKALEIVATVTSEPCGSIRRVNVEIPTLSISDFRRLKATDHVGTYTLFQETYHSPTFKQVHPSGPKSKYEYRLQTMDRAQIGGIDDVGIGALFGLYDYRFEVLALLQHAHHLDKTYKAGPHTISIPRIRPAHNAPLALQPPYPVDDDNFQKMVAILRCCVPYTGMILSTRESPDMRHKLLRLGISQMSAGSRTEVGSYHKGDSWTGDKKDLAADPDPGQFSLLDHRAADDIVYDLLQNGYVPSWCTACYRKKRTGEAFMKIAKKGDIHQFCHPNSLLTLEEYLQDYASEKTKKLGAEVIESELENGLSDRSKRSLLRKLKRVDEGERDIFL